MSLATNLAERAAEVQARIDAAARRAGRDPSAVLIVAVSKTHSQERIADAYAAGLRHFGENRVEEAGPKIAMLRNALPDAKWHMIGHIQSRKASGVAAMFDQVHSVERVKIARLLSQCAQGDGKVISVLLEVNLSGEESKDGYNLAGWPANSSGWNAFCRDVEAILALPGVLVEGLMTMAPYVDNPETVRPIFRRMRDLRERLRERYTTVGWRHLSMGMTGDYEIAVEEGATMVRIGTALFGPRETMP